MNSIKALLIGFLIVVTGCGQFNTRDDAPAQRPDAYDIFVEASTAEPAAPVEQPETASREEAGVGTRVIETPQAPDVIASEEAIEFSPQVGEYGEDRVEVSFSGIPLPAFINEVYGNLLKESYFIEPSLARAEDLVTMRAVEKPTKDELARMAAEVLDRYGVGIMRTEGVLRFYPRAARGSDQPPLLVSGRTLPDVPLSHRTIFQFVPLKVVRNALASGWLKQIFAGKNLQVFDDIERNSILLMGSPQLVSYAMETLQVLDQPLMRGKYSAAISPYYLDADTMAMKLVEVLQAEGFSASTRPPTGSVIVLPVPQSEMVIAFAGDQMILEHIQDWAIKLDVPSNNKNETLLHYYQVRNTQAEELAKDIEQLLATISESIEVEGERRSGTAQRRFGGNKVVVDENRNGLILNITGEEWEKLLPILKKMDRPARLVLIEVTLASITLTDNFASGIDWVRVTTELGDYSVNWSAPLGLEGGSLTARVLDNAGDVRAILSLFEQDQRVEIMSRPHIMVKSGTEAVMEVGTEIPVVTSQVSAPDIPESSINQNIQYRKTGLLLNVTPTVHSGDRIDLVVAQEVSEALASESATNPSIFSRRVQTNMTLNNGGSVIIGGLIAENETSGETRIPVLGSAPLVGKFFRKDTEEKIRNEVLILIQGFVIDDDGQAKAATEALRQRFGNANQMIQAK